MPRNNFCGQRRNLIMRSLCLLIFTAPCIVGQQTMVSPDDVAWRTSIQSAASGAVFIFQPGVYHACGILLNTGCFSPLDPYYIHNLCNEEGATTKLSFHVVARIHPARMSLALHKEVVRGLLQGILSSFLCGVLRPSGSVSDFRGCI